MPWTLQEVGEDPQFEPFCCPPALVEEGSEIIAESGDKEDAAADLALIGAAQRVEHYETAG
jgi:Mn-containing catalase